MNATRLRPERSRCSVAMRPPAKLSPVTVLKPWPSDFGPHTTKGAPFTFGGFYDADRNEVRFGIEVPRLLSLLATHDPNSTIQGLSTVPEEDRPPVNIVRYAFQTMVGLGTALGDTTATNLHLGYWWSALLFSLLMVVPTVAWRLGATEAIIAQTPFE